LSHMKFIDVIKLNHELGENLTGNEYKVAVISNITINQIKEFFELSLRTEGINTKVIVGGYDSIAQDSIDFAQMQAVLVFWEAGNLVDGLHCKADVMTQDDLEALEGKIEREIDFVLRNLQNTSLVLVNRFSSLLFSSGALRNGALTRLCKRLNVILESRVGPNQVIVDLDAILAKVGLADSVDFRQYMSSKALYSLEFFREYVEAVKPAFMAATGRVKKIIVLDCDNTLWGGILGEDGASGLQMSEATQKGKAFAEVQTILRGLRKEGVLLALCSKNNPADVDHILAGHPDMILKDEDLVAKRVNWLDKATNLQELATELNLGLDSFVFIDDSLFELGLVQREMPQVKCIQVPKTLSEYPALIQRLRRDFFSLSRASEDERKTEMYREEKQRQAQVSQYNSIEEYWTSLKLQLTIQWDEQIPVARAAQLSQKTNQFNLTTRRYTEDDIQRMLADPLYTLVVFSAADHYGDYGATGMAIVREDAAHSGCAVVDSFLMSCRIIGRNIEYSFFDEFISVLHMKGIRRLRGEYFATTKNSQVAKFYDRIGFELTSDKESSRDYRILLSDYKYQNIKYIKTDGTGAIV
jgi:FkbH-like protein